MESLSFVILDVDELPVTSYTEEGIFGHGSSDAESSPDSVELSLHTHHRASARSEGHRRIMEFCWCALPASFLSRAFISGYPTHGCYSKYSNVLVESTHDSSLLSNDPDVEICMMCAQGKETVHGRCNIMRVKSKLYIKDSPLGKKSHHEVEIPSYIHNPLFVKRFYV